MDKEFVVEGIFDLDDLQRDNIIKFIDVVKEVDINKNNNVKILSICINIEDFNISEKKNNTTYIYCISFIYIISLNISKDSIFEEITVKGIYSNSFKYLNLNISQVKIYPINIDVRNLDDKLYFNMNFVLIDNFKNIICTNNEFIYDNKENLISKDNTNLNIDKKYYYINLNKEFM